MKRFFKSPRTHLLLLAASLIVFSSIAGLCAYLVDKRTYTSYFRTPSSDELGFIITGTVETEALLTPGKPFEMPVEASVSGSIPLYVFVEYDISDGLILYNLNDEDWHPIAEDSNVYYHGENGECTVLSGSSTFIDVVFVPEETENDKPFELKITGYAIQSIAIPADLGPEGIYMMAKEETP